MSAEQAGITAEQAAAAIESHFVIVDVTARQPRRTISGRPEDFGLDPELADALEDVGKPGGFDLVSPEFAREFDKRRKAAQRACEAYSIPFTTHGGIIRLVPQRRLREAVEAIERHQQGLVHWMEDGAGLEQMERDTRERLERYCRVLEVKFDARKAETFRERVVTRLATAQDMRAATITCTVDKLEINAGAIDGLDDFARDAVVRSRNEMALELARHIPEQIAGEIVDTLDALLRRDDLTAVPEVLSRRLERTATFALDNDYAGDPLTAQGAATLMRAREGGVPRAELEKLRSTFAMQRKLFAARDRDGELGNAISAALGGGDAELV